MRVSERMLFNSIFDRLQRQTESLLKTQEQVSSGRMVNRPSDDPIGQAQILNLDTSIAMTDQRLRNIGEAEAFMSVSEAALQTVQNQLTRAHELAVQMANATYTAADRADAAKEIRQIYDQLIAVANTTQGGQYIFAGNKTSTTPFVSQGRYIGTPLSLPVTITTGVNDGLTVTADGVSGTVAIPAGSYTTGAQLADAIQTAINGNAIFQTAGVAVSAKYDIDHLVITSNAVGGTSAVTPTGGSSLATLGLSAGTNQLAGTYLGDSAETPVLIGTNVTVTKNLPGDRFFKGAGGGVDILAAVGGLQNALETDDLAGLNTALTNLDAAEGQVNNERALLGARLNRTETTAGILEDLKPTFTRFKSEREDVDIARAVSNLVQQQTILEATRATAARLVQRSLLDFLR